MKSVRKKEKENERGREARITVLFITKTRATIEVIYNNVSRQKWLQQTFAIWNLQ